MSDIKKQRLKKLAKFLFIKFPIFLGIIALMMIVSLKMVERFPDPLREGFQQYLSQAYNTNATIGQLEKIAFFPKIDVRASDITMHNNANAALIDMEIKSIAIQSPFWSMIFNTGHLNRLMVEGLKANAGFILPHAIEINKLDIIDKEGPDQYGSFVVAEGSYNNQEMNFEAEIKKIKSGYKILGKILLILAI